MRRLDNIKTESGIALVMAIGILAVTSLSVAAAVEYTTSNERNSNSSKATVSALALAEAGMNNARAQLYSASDATNPAAMPAQATPQTLTLEGGTASYWGSYDVASSTWTLRSVGKVRNPTGAADISKRVTSSVVVERQLTAPASQTIWNYFYSWDHTLTLFALGNTRLDTPVYANGWVHLQDNAELRGSKLHVGNGIDILDSARVGNNGIGGRIDEAQIRWGCKTTPRDDYWTGPPSSQFHPCTDADRLYATTRGTTPTPITRPALDLPGMHANAFGAQRPCTTGSTTFAFDTDALLNKSAGTVNIAPDGTGYDCQWRNASGDLIGQLKWTPPGGDDDGGSRGTLVISGTVFIDGNIRLDEAKIQYQGRGTIYTSGWIHMTETEICASSGCNGSWDPEQNMLALVAGEDTQWWGFKMEEDSTFEGMIYSERKFWTVNGVEIWGPVIARYHWLDDARVHYVPFDELPPGVPSDAAWTTSLQTPAEAYGN